MSKADEMRALMEARAEERRQSRESGLTQDADASLNIELGVEGGVKLPMNLIDPSPFQLRRVFPQDYIEGLAESIRNEGLNQPIVVVRRGERFQLIAGENRFRAYKYLGEDQIPAIIRHIDDIAAARSVVADNLQHNTISDYESYLGLVILKESGVKTHSELARIIGRDRKHIWRLFHYAELPEKVIQMLESEPALFGCNCAEILADFTLKGHGDLVTQAVEKIKESKLKQMSAGSWIESKLQVKKRLTVKQPLLIGNKEIGSITVKDNKIEINVTNDDDIDLIENIRTLILTSMLEMKSSPAAEGVLLAQSDSGDEVEQ